MSSGKRVFGAKTALIFTIFMCFVFRCSSQPLQVFVKTALNYSEKGMYAEAMTTYDSALTKYPNEPLLHVLKGELATKYSTQMSLPDTAYKIALAAFNRALALDSNFLPAYSSKGLLNLVNQRYEEAIIDFTRVLNLTGGDPDRQFSALADRATAKMYMKNFSGALDDYLLAAGIRPNDIGILNNLATLYFNLGKFNEAEKRFSYILDIDPQNLDALNNLAAVFIARSNYGKAIEVLNKAIKIYPSDGELLSNLGFAHIQLGFVEQGIKEIDNALLLYPSDAYAYKHRAIGYIKLGEIQKACEDLNSANRLGYSLSFDDEVNELLIRYCGK